MWVFTHHGVQTHIRRRTRIRLRRRHQVGREDGEWTVFVSPGHWATIEIGKDTKEKKDDKDDD